MHPFFILLLSFLLMALPLSAQPASLAPSASDSMLRSEQHRGMFIRLSGLWEAKSKWWKNGPDSKPLTAKGVGRWGMIPGTYLRMEDSLASKDDSLWCESLLSYDRAQNRMVMVRTGYPDGSLPLYTGVADSNFKRITVETPLAPDSSRSRIVLRVTDGNHHTVEFWQIFPNGTQIKEREIAYKRLR
jgi:hypothetical protein